ncbi:SprT family zinc-dependent metalloprotease [Herbaspirillum sp. RV1423]|uniref:YgjP family zinc-dependent metalloprotease n=1 Tax=Herbaspirillum sp. RV1423 TaxID=1443993 RepID=UPI0004B180A6|nr:SprT family zinc-dependent metalloprotease [Herbaspirillum sp. RV1423]
MPVLAYGRTTIEWRFELAAHLKRHYVTVERGCPVLLRGPRIAAPAQEALIRRRARWIREKLALVNQPQSDERIVTGSRLRYGGRSYVVEVIETPALTQPRLRFTASRFVIEHPDGRSIEQEQCMPLLEQFYRQRAQDRLPARLRHWQRATGLQSQGLRVRRFESRWASCSAGNVLEFHPRVMELPAATLDYIIVHELCHTVERSHTRAFWQEVARHFPDWRAQHEILQKAVFGDAV